MFSDYTQLEQAIDYSFNDKKLLDKALTHKSYAVERKIRQNNERLEFLGDSVLGLIVSEYLIKNYRDKDEGHLSKLKSYIVSSKNIYEWAKKFNLASYIKLSQSELNTGGRGKPQIIANAFESLIGAIYLDGGLDVVKKLVTKLIEETSYNFVDYKSFIQEYCQKKYKTLPVYKLISQSGPDHKKLFNVALIINKQEVSRGEGKSKKEAEQDAAKKASLTLKLEGLWYLNLQKNKMK